MSLQETLRAAKDVFFVGYLKIPRPLALFFLVLIPPVLAAAIGTGLGFLAAQGDVGSGRFVFPYAERTGILDAEPYPVLHMPPSADHPDGHAIILAGQGKRGVVDASGPLGGEPVDVGGVFLIRGEAGSEMIQVGGAAGLRAALEPVALAGFSLPEPEALGRHELKGEIVDSKCFLGAMRPGQGKVHMACAGLCLMGGIPPLFVTYGPDGESTEFLLAGPDGGPVGPEILAYVSLYVGLEGEVERRSDLLVFKVEASSLEVL